MKANKNKLLNLILPVFSVACLVIVWAVASFTIDNEYILPSVSQTAKEFAMLFCQTEFYLALTSTLLRSLIAFIVAFILGGLCAILAFKMPLFLKVTQPIIAIIRALPTIAVVLLLLFWTNSKIAPIIVTTLVVLPTIYTQIINALFGLDKTVAEAGRVDGADEKQVFLNIELPQILPTVYDTIGSGFSLNFKLMVAAEVIAQTANSLGFMLNISKVYFEIAKMLALVCVSVILGVIIEIILARLSRKADGWR
ncbi:MAG: ABC transporter permease subunit [Clostridia bacterium]|nr:ABC transporter permease subunit [Clostridia bacterium]